MQIELKKHSIAVTIGAGINFIWYWLEVLAVFIYLLFRSPLVLIRRMGRGEVKTTAADNYEIETDLKKIKLETFNTCYESKDYSLLIVSGNPTPEQLQKAWRAVLSKYYKLSGDKTAQKHIELRWEITELDTRLTAVQLTVDALRVVYDERLINILKGHPYNYNRRTFSPETITEDLNWVETAEKRIKIIRNRLETELDKTTSGANQNRNPDSPEGRTTTNIYENLFEIRKYEKMEQSPTELMKLLSVADYCMYLKRLREHMENMERNVRLQSIKNRGQ